MGQLTEGLLSLSGWTALVLLFVLPALEAPAFLGLVLPGELALLLGGVLAQSPHPPGRRPGRRGRRGGGRRLGRLLDRRRWGPRLPASPRGRRVGPARLDKVESLLLRGGGGPWSSAAAPPGPGSGSPGGPACSGRATGPSGSGPGWRPPSGRPPTSYSAIWPAPAGATSTT